MVRASPLDRNVKRDGAQENLLSSTKPGGGELLMRIYTVKSSQTSNFLPDCPSSIPVEAASGGGGGGGSVPIAHRNTIVSRHLFVDNAPSPSTDLLQRED